MNCREVVVFPICIRQDDGKTFQIVFPNLKLFQIGVPSNESQRKLYLAAVKQAMDKIHACKVAHIDFYPSNIMWNYDNKDENMTVKIIDWDSGLRLEDNMFPEMAERMPRARQKLAAAHATSRKGVQFSDYDASLFSVLKENIGNVILQTRDKATLDEAFRQLCEKAAKAKLDETFPCDNA